jgi:hypothetical protein
METDRSRIIAAQRCPRERYLAYHHLGTGLQRTRKSLPLQFGSAFHEGTEVLLSNADTLALTNSPNAEPIDHAVARAHAFLHEQFTNHFVGFDGETPDDVQAAMEYGVEEQMALAEGLLRAWWAYEGESFLEAFEVIEVEQEGRADLVRSDYDATRSLTLMYRPDALVRERATGDLYVISWKTCATFGPRNIAQARHDMQSMSEVFGLEETNSHCEGGGEDYDSNVKVEGVLYKWIVKGSRRKDNWDGLYKQSSHLIYGWMKLPAGSAPGEDTEWSWSYDWEKEDGSGSSRLGKGWKKVPIWSHYPGGVKQWIADLAAGQVFPRHMDPLAAIFPQALPVERRQDEVESWKRQVVVQELKIAENVRLMDGIDVNIHHNGENPHEHTAMLDELFPQYTHSCHSYSGCSFIPVCWEGVKPEPGELYQIRTANHPEKGEGDD